MLTSAISTTEIQNTLAAQKNFFDSGATQSLSFRREQLQKLYDAIVQNENEIFAALHADLHKSKFESFGTEIGLVLGEIKHTLRKLATWMRPQKVGTSLFHFPASSYTQAEALGQVLIIAPWNYPFQLLFSPLVGAIAAGNTVVLKPSEIAENCSRLFTRIVRETFSSEYMAIFEGGVEVSQSLLAEKYDMIFFTGSTPVGKVVYQAAAKHLTPVVLELGGKSPCIVAADAPLATTAKRIVWGKFVNAGQTCIAPDYIFAHKSIVQELIAELAKAIEAFYGSNIEASPDYPRIINEKNFNRLVQLISDEKIVYGGKADKAALYISPTILYPADAKDAAMQEEIFGPILPILPYENLESIVHFIRQRPKPLALYVFSKNNKTIDYIMQNTSAGGCTINDTLIHLANDNMHFGGVGESGIGGYHGKSSFEAFSHQKAITRRGLWLDVPLRYPPYNRISLNSLKWLFKNVM
ncbi:MAG: aldehyde dehydrogenase [Chitinophagales bacterium]|nr:aldehyde dehydrogenase [Bacteroidota bacterium]MCB9043874.1 aldehyde dehydrogenase [Chitinophagales bacterium]